MTPEEIEIVAHKLHQAEKNRQQIKAITIDYPNMDVDDAYKIQSKWMEIKLAEGRKLAGYKIGLTSRTMQKAMNIDEPDYGMLLDDMVFHDGDTIKASDFLDPRIEVELCFFLKEELFGDNLTKEDVLAATDYIAPALEMIAARSYRVDPDTRYGRNVKDTISDNAANGGVIIGKYKIDPYCDDLCWIGAMMSKNGIIEESGVSGAVLGHPALGIVWLAKKYAQHGIPLKPGQIILSGSFTRPIIVQAGDKIDVDFNHYGQISLNFN